MATKVPQLLFKKTWVDFLKEEFGNDPQMTMSVFFAICDYAYDGKVPDDMALRLAIGAIRKEIDEDKKAYEAVSEKRRTVRLEAIAKQKNVATNVDFVNETATNQTNVTNQTNGTNIIYSNIDNSNELYNIKKTKAKKTKIQQPIIETDEQIAFDNWLKENYPRIYGMERRMALDEYNKLISIYGQSLVIAKMDSLNNSKSLDKYVYAYATINNWCKMYDNGKSKTKPSGDLSANVLNDIFGEAE